MGIITLGAAALFLALMIVGIAIAKRPLARPGYWLRHGVGVAAVIAMALLGQLMIGLDAGAAPTDTQIILSAVYGILFVILALVLNMLLMLWTAQRLIDIGWSRWWALLAAFLFPIPTIVFGAIPSRPVMSESAAVETFG